MGKFCKFLVQLLKKIIIEVSDNFEELESDKKSVLNDE